MSGLLREVVPAHLQSNIPPLLLLRMEARIAFISRSSMVVVMRS